MAFYGRNPLLTHFLLTGVPCTQYKIILMAKWKSNYSTPPFPDVDLIIALGLKNR
jgi:hypothetical protein